MNKPGCAVDILVVEDNEQERESIVDSLIAAIPGTTVVSVHDGAQALDFLFGRAEWGDRKGEDPPKLILLDLEMPGADGFSIMGQIRSCGAQDELNLTPIVIFTDSTRTGDIGRSYRCGANSYIIKPISYPDFQAVVQTVGRYWLEHNMAA